MSNLAEVVAAIAVAVVVLFVQTIVLMFCWDVALVGTIDGVNEIGFWQAFMLPILIKVLKYKVQ